MSAGATNPDRLVVVVHGVGDPQPGETLSLFTRSLAEDERPLHESQLTLWLNEKPDRPEQVKTFPAHVRKLQLKNESVELVEGFWGDLSQVQRGFLGIIFGLFQILFGLRYVAYVAADQPGVGAFWLKRLGLISSRILHGPVMAVTFYLAVLSFAVVVTQVMWPESYTGIVWTQVVLAACAAVAIFAAQTGAKVTRSRVVQRFWFWVCITTAFVTGLMLIKFLFVDTRELYGQYTNAVHPGLIWYCRVLVVLLGLLWFVETLVVIAMAVCWLIARMQPGVNRRALNLAFLLPALAVGIWGQALPMLWVAAREGIGKTVKLDKFQAIFDEAIPMLGIQFVMFIAISIVAMFIVIRYLQQRSVITAEAFAAGERVPRLIVHPVQQLALAVCTLIGVSLVMSISIVENMGGSWHDFAMGRLMAESNKYAVAVIVPLGGTILFLLPRMRGVFDIVLDVVNHFYFRATNLKDWLDDDDEFDIRETTFESGALFFSRREQIIGRVKRILTHYRDEFSHRPELVLVSHSQGTVDVAEALNDPELEWLGNSFAKVSLVTMGSPITHLYQHYFGHLYPPLSDRFWKPLHQRLDRWVNIFRIDDYVGLDIDFGHLPANEADRDAMQQNHAPGQIERHFTHCSNHPVGPRGHSRYWSDAEVLQILREQIFAPQSDSRTRAA